MADDAGSHPLLLAGPVQGIERPQRLALDAEPLEGGEHVRRQLLDRLRLPLLQPHRGEVEPHKSGLVLLAVAEKTGPGLQERRLRAAGLPQAGEDLAFHPTQRYEVQGLLGKRLPKPALEKHLRRVPEFTALDHYLEEALGGRSEEPRIPVAVQECKSLAQNTERPARVTFIVRIDAHAHERSPREVVVAHLPGELADPAQALAGIREPARCVQE